MKNVLLLCMSTVKKVIKKGEYSFKYADGQEGKIEGYMTNEAPAKAVIKQLDALGDGQRLDRVVMICSDSVKQKINVTSNESPIEHPENSSHIEFYKTMINTFAEETNIVYREKPIEYAEVCIPDFTEADQISESVISAANQVIDLDDDIQLHLDFNGGQRYVAFMLVAIANLMKNRRVDIRQVMTMNFENKEVTPIQNMAPVFRSFDLISGINEYVNYGRTKGLKTYFADAQNDEIQKVLTKMEKFANNLQLCRTGYIMREKGKLLQMLTEYLKKERDKNELSAYEQLFLYVVKDILDGYRGILDGDLPGIVKWCVERDFVQQALTFCVEEMPDYFWKQKIFTATQQEKKEYNHFLEKLRDANGWNYRRIKSDYQSGMDESSSKYAYNWMIKYIQFSDTQPDYKRLLEDSDAEFKQLIFLQPEEKKMEEVRKNLGPFTEFDVSRVPIRTDQMQRAKKSAEKLVWSREEKRVCSTNIKKKTFAEVIILYFLLKEQRNATNHASGGEHNGGEWSCDVLCRVLKQLAEKLVELQKSF